MKLTGDEERRLKELRAKDRNLSISKDERKELKELERKKNTPVSLDQLNDSVNALSARLDAIINRSE
jgi:hypothetical protein